MFPNLIVMKEIPMTASEMLAAYVKAAKKKEVEDYVNEVLADMSEEDLYCTSVKQTYDNDGDNVY